MTFVFLACACLSMPACFWPNTPQFGIAHELDIDTDGQTDFILEYTSMHPDDSPQTQLWNHLMLSPQDEHMRQGSGWSPFDPIPEATMVDFTGPWSEHQMPLAGISWTRGVGWDDQWSGWWIDDEGYIGLQLVMDEAQYFGWLDVSVDPATGDATINDYAYQPIDGVGILTGEHPQ